MTAQLEPDAFDETASRHSTSKTAAGSVTDAILAAAQDVGIDAVSELYNEALELAKDGHLGLARQRLDVLLGLAPEDADAHLLLAKVHVAGQQWRRAMAELDLAVEYGAMVPEDLHDNVVRHVQADVDEDEDERAARLAREQGELKKLRADTRRLRSEHAHLAQKARSSELEAKRWMWVGSVVSVVGIGFILSQTLLGGPEEATEAAETATVATATTTVVAAPAGAPVRDPDQKAKADAALADAGFPDAKAIVRGTKASLSGTVPTFADKKKAAEAVQALGVVETVDVDSLVNLAARDGAVYTVVSGDTLSKIAARMYGKASLADRILQANPELGGKASALRVGQQLKVPPEE
jgi:nucleoid-associated protein YgaU